jgi:hypothetical protein
MVQGKDGNCRDCNKDCGEAEITLDALSFHVRLLLIYQLICGNQWLAATSAAMIVPVMNVDRTGTLADALGLSLMPAANIMRVLTTSVPTNIIPAKMKANISNSPISR